MEEVSGYQSSRQGTNMFISKEAQYSTFMIEERKILRNSGNKYDDNFDMLNLGHMHIQYEF